MSRPVSFLTPILLLPLLNCGGSPHDVQEKYFFVSANIKVPYWQEAAAGFNHAAAQMHVKAEFVGPDTYDPKAQHEQFQRMLEDARNKSEARKAWEACKCPHCGRNDPLPPWLY